MYSTIISIANYSNKHGSIQSAMPEQSCMAQLETTIVKYVNRIRTVAEGCTDYNGVSRNMLIQGMSYTSNILFTRNF